MTLRIPERWSKPEAANPEEFWEQQKNKGEINIQSSELPDLKDSHAFKQITT